MKTFLNIFLFLGCLFISTVARPQSIFDDLFVQTEQGNPQQDNPFLPQRPGGRPPNPFFPSSEATTPPTVTTSTARTRTTASPEYLACMNRCPTTSQYNPVCGSDNINYHNDARLQCARLCGKSVSAVRGGTCSAL